MCTSVSFLSKDHYFGRNLDLSYSYQEAVTVMPRNFPLHFRCTRSIPTHYAMIGMATIDDNYPLFYDATNEYGLSMAGLNFPDNAVYLTPADCAVNITPFELIPWVLCQCKTVEEACILLKDVRIADIPYSEKYPLTPLHWMLSDKTASVTLEPTENQLTIYQNPIGVLTNNPPFPYHLENLRQYVHLTSKEPETDDKSWCKMAPASHSSGALGLPGDFSSVSRFIRAAYIKECSFCDGNEPSNVIQYFHILQCVQQPKGCIRHDGSYDRTVYSSCCNTDKGIYYYTTYENSQLTAVNLHSTDLDSKELTAYPLRNALQIHFEN